MDRRKFRFHDNHEFFHAACSVDSRRQTPVQSQTVSRSQRLAEPPQESPHPDEHRKLCTLREIASELSYSWPPSRAISTLASWPSVMRGHFNFRNQ